MFEIKRHLLQVADCLPVFPEVLDFQSLEFTRFPHESEPEELGPRIPDVVVVVQIRRRRNNQINGTWIKVMQSVQKIVRDYAASGASRQPLQLLAKPRDIRFHCQKLGGY